jgi:hypothetical protein
MKKLILVTSIMLLLGLAAMTGDQSQTPPQEAISVVSETNLSARELRVQRNQEARQRTRTQIRNMGALALLYAQRPFTTASSAFASAYTAVCTWTMIRVAKYVVATKTQEILPPIRTFLTVIIPGTTLTTLLGLILWAFLSSCFLENQT